MMVMSDFLGHLGHNYSRYFWSIWFIYPRIHTFTTKQISLKFYLMSQYELKAVTDLT